MTDDTRKREQKADIYSSLRVDVSPIQSRQSTTIMTKVTTIFLVLFVAAFEWSMVKSATTTKTPSMTTTTMMPSMTTTPKPLAINTNTGPKCGSVDDCKVLSPFYRSCKAAPVAGNCDVRGECFGGDFDTNETLECGSGKKCAFLNTDESSFCISKYSTHKSVQQDNAARMAAPQGSTQPPPVAPFENKRKNPSCKSVNDCLSKSEFYKSCFNSTGKGNCDIVGMCTPPGMMSTDCGAGQQCVFINKRLNLCLSAFITRQALSTVPKQLSQAATN